MDTSNARALLGVGVDASPEELRRAYLRACKRHRPETDPEGFKAVRAAYELLLLDPPSHPHPIEPPPPAPSAARDDATPLVPARPEEAPHELAAWLGWLAALEPADLLGRATIEQLERCAWAATTGLTTYLGANAAARPVAPLMLVALALWARDREERADALVRRLRREPGSTLGGMSATWSLVRDLQAIGRGAAPMVRAMAEALLRRSDAPFTVWLGGEPIIERSRWREVLANCGETLASRFAPVFDTFDGMRPPSSFRSWGWGLLLLVVPMIGGLVSVVASGGSRGDGDDSLGPVIPARREHKAMCDASKVLCARYDELTRAITDGDCAAGVDAWRAVEEHAATSPALLTEHARVTLTPALRSVYARLVGRCSPAPSATAGSGPP